jgi:hypothetical protein
MKQKTPMRRTPDAELAAAIAAEAIGCSPATTGDIRPCFQSNPTASN